MHEGSKKMVVLQNTVKMFAEDEFKEFEPQLKFKTRLKYGWFFSNVSRFKLALIETGYWRILDAAQIY